MCNPDQCWRLYHNNANHTEKTRLHSAHHLSKYWRFDRTSPKFTNPTTLALPSIPAQFRIPPSRFHDIASYFQEKHDFAKAHNSSLDFLVEYNPGLVPIPPDMLPYLPEGTTYLLSLRVTPANNCFSATTYDALPKDVWTSVFHTSINHLGLALLNAQYEIIPGGYDVVIELDVPLDLKRSSISKRRGGTHFESADPTFMDYRLFLLNNEIYLHANADTVVISKLRLRAKGYYGNDDGNNNSETEDIVMKTCDEVAKEAGEEGSWETPCQLNNKYGGDKLQVTLMRQFNTIWSGGMHGKNYALFALPNTTHPNSPDSMYAELDIFPHRVQQILPDEYDQLTRKRVFEMIWKPGVRRKRDFKIDRVNMRAVKEVGNATVSAVLPLPSFFTVDAHEEWFPGAEAPFKEAAHGGACCVSFSIEELSVGYHGAYGSTRPTSSLLVGIGHTKVTWKHWYGKDNVSQEEKDRVPHTHYVSLFYAFDPYPPFHIRARSGYFCLGHAPLSTQDINNLPPGERGIFNPHSILTMNRMLLQNNIVFNCPQMSFISTFIEKVGNASKTVIGYGLNDCTGRLVEVEKREIVRLLFPDPMDMIFENSHAMD